MFLTVRSHEGVNSPNIHILINQLSYMSKLMRFQTQAQDPVLCCVSQSGKHWPSVPQGLRANHVLYKAPHPHPQHLNMWMRLMNAGRQAGTHDSSCMCTTAVSRHLLSPQGDECWLATVPTSGHLLVGVLRPYLGWRQTFGLRLMFFCDTHGPSNQCAMIRSV